MDVEDGYDFVNVVDGHGVLKSFTGKKEVKLELKTPAIISFVSDYAGQSKLVQVNQI